MGKKIKAKKQQESKEWEESKKPAKKRCSLVKKKEKCDACRRENRCLETKIYPL